MIGIDIDIDIRRVTIWTTTLHKFRVYFAKKSPNYQFFLIPDILHETKNRALFVSNTPIFWQSFALNRDNEQTFTMNPQEQLHHSCLKCVCFPAMAELVSLYSTLFSDIIWMDNPSGSINVIFFTLWSFHWACTQCIYLNNVDNSHFFLLEDQNVSPCVCAMHCK